MQAPTPGLSRSSVTNRASLGVGSSARSTPLRGRRLVFLAEDDAELRRLLRDSLLQAGYDVLSASTGHEMLAMLAAASRGEVPIPDAFVMDVRMPRCSGLDVLTAIRLAEWEQPVVMLTGFGDPSLHESATRRGASVSLDKPVDTDDLIDIIDALLCRGQGEHDDDAPETSRCPTSAA